MGLTKTKAAFKKKAKPASAKKEKSSINMKPLVASGKFLKSKHGPKGDGDLGEEDFEEEVLTSDIDNVLDKKYFIYIVSDSNNPFYKKTCIGKVVLPPEANPTLADLRSQILKFGDETVRETLRKNKSFRFLSETYRFVAQNEAIASVNEVYPTQGIFIKQNIAEPLTAIAINDHIITNESPKTSMKKRAKNRRKNSKDSVDFLPITPIKKDQERAGN